MATITKTIGESLDYESRMRIFEREFHPLFGGLYAFAYRLTNDGTAAEDLVQDALLKAWNSIDSYLPNTNAKAWLYTICRNAFINGCRATARKPKITDFAEVVATHHEDEIERTNFSEMHEDLYFRLLGDEVTNALSLLNAEQRVAVLLELEDFTYEEIAAIMDCPIGTVRSRLSRGRDALKEKLYQYALSQGYIGRQTDGDKRMPA
ncbi:MAG: sigma-70 family RNA polymerase sigma factor [Saprospiraceae bacterium]|nr:sigma-70 family RNA polymerase sigma factor [Saprospiraceae bacterium]